jgi:hypothetical protein
VVIRDNPSLFLPDLLPTLPFSRFASDVYPPFRGRVPDLLDIPAASRMDWTGSGCVCLILHDRSEHLVRGCHFVSGTFAISLHTLDGSKQDEEIAIFYKMQEMKAKCDRKVT